MLIYNNNYSTSFYYYLKLDYTIELLLLLNNINYHNFLLIDLYNFRYKAQLHFVSNMLLLSVTGSCKNE